MTDNMPDSTASNSTVPDFTSTTTNKNSVTAWIQTARLKWEKLSQRDQFALILLSVFLFAVVGGYGGYVIHNMASEQKESYQTTVNEYFWLRAQAANINTNMSQNQDVPLNQTVSQILNQMGAQDAQVLAVGDSVQMSFTHRNQTAASNIVGAMVNSGVQVEQLVMQQSPDNSNIRVQATVN